MVTAPPPPRAPPATPTRIRPATDPPRPPGARALVNRAPAPPRPNPQPKTAARRPPPVLGAQAPERVSRPPQPRRPLRPRKRPPSRKRPPGALERRLPPRRPRRTFPANPKCGQTCLWSLVKAFSFPFQPVRRSLFDRGFRAPFPPAFPSTIPGRFEPCGRRSQTHEKAPMSPRVIRCLSASPSITPRVTKCYPMLAPNAAPATKFLLSTTS